MLWRIVAVAEEDLGRSCVRQDSLIVPLAVHDW
jgi:hypothetical protein